VNFHTPFNFQAPFTGFVPELHYTDIAGHGTHVAGIAAGKTYGWAKEADIYALKMKDLSGGLTEAEMFDAIIGWHNNKTNGRPTVVNMSWGYGGYYADFDITGGRYRGLDWSDNAEKPEYGMGDLGSFPVRNYSTDTGIEEMIAAGIHVCISSGNDGVKIDVPGGPDYNNLFLFNHGMGTDFYYYQRGSSPYSRHALMVGSLDSIPYNATYDRKADYSNGGPGVDIYTPGTAIMSSTSTENMLADDGYQDAVYFLDSDFKQANLSGTSMASPELAGMIAVWLQANPHATPAQMKTWVLANASNSMYDYNSNGMDYQTTHSTWGGSARVAYNHFNAASALALKNIMP
jgi:subtilisin family serine protease